MFKWWVKEGRPTQEAVYKLCRSSGQQWKDTEKSLSWGFDNTRKKKKKKKKKKKQPTTLVWWTKNNVSENNNVAIRILLSMKLARKQPVIRPKESV